MKTLHFKTKKGYQKWLAYEHMRTPTGKMVRTKHGRHSIAELSTKKPMVVIAGHKHKVKHSLY